MSTLTLTLHRTFTLAIAILLSWVTATDQRVNRMVASLLRLPATCGAEPAERLPSPVGPERVPQAVVPAAVETPPDGPGRAVRTATHTTTVHDTRLAALGLSGEQQQRLQQLGHRLRSLGASYLLLERWQQPASDLCYRVRCDLSGAEAAVHCSFEATRQTPVAAMEEVLQAVQRVNGRRTITDGGSSTREPSGNGGPPPVRIQGP